MKRRDFAIGLGAAAFGAQARAADVIAQAPAMGWILGEARGDIGAVERAWAAARAPKSPLGRSDALVVAQNGKLVFERYDPDHGANVRHISWSMAKSITHALVGIAVAEGRVDIDRPLKLVAHPDPKLTLRALLTLTDGLGWDEGSYSPTDSDAARMLYGKGRMDGAAYTAAMKQTYRPGTRFNYSTGSYQLAAAELQASLFPGLTDPHARRAAVLAWMKNRLFDPLAMSSAQPEFDASGTFVGGSWVYATARDFARFGEFYRLDGMWAGRRILPPGWVKFARTPTVEPVYGAGFWLEAPAGHKPPSLMAGRGPLDAFSAQGHNGQLVVIVPSKALVIVRLALMPDDDPTWAKLGAWLTPVVNAFPDV
jgi:CubicO group peptidase (beta-lactamase class C family)